ncbi:MAG TPA: hypothetical protein VIM81_03550 [Gammaproteobacteria bacterium]|jgi:hypothetical protein
MKTFALGLIAAAALVVLPVQAGFADGRHHHSHVSIGLGFGFGDPFYYRPYRYYYPSYGYGFDIWPRYRTRVRTVSDRGEVRTQKLYVYPAAGQSTEQTAEDRYQCHVWAVDATEFDPTLGAGTAAEAEGYGRAFTACMEGRNYVVK